MFCLLFLGLPQAALAGGLRLLRLLGLPGFLDLNMFVFCLLGLLWLVLAVVAVGWLAGWLLAAGVDKVVDLLSVFFYCVLGPLLLLLLLLLAAGSRSLGLLAHFCP